MHFTWVNDRQNTYAWYQFMSCLKHTLTENAIDGGVSPEFIILIICSGLYHAFDTR